MRAGARPGYFQGDGDLEGAAGFDVHQRVEHRLGPVEVRGQPPAPVAVEQRVQPDVHLAAQMRGQDVGGEREIVAVLVADALAPAAAYRRDPPRLSGAPVVEPDCVHLRAGAQYQELRF